MRKPVLRCNNSPLEGESQKPSPFPELVEGSATADAVGGFQRLSVCELPEKT